MPACRPAVPDSLAKQWSHEAVPPEKAMSGPRQACAWMCPITVPSPVP